MSSKTNFIYFVSLISALGGFLFGYDWVVIGGAKPFYEEFFAISNNEVAQGWAMSCALIGCLVGALLTGVFSDKFGRKKMLIASGLLFIISAVGTGAASDFTWFVVYRILGGFAIGIASNLSPMYIAEIAPAHLRGRLVSFNQLTIVLGILAAQITNLFIADKVAVDATPVDILNSWNGQWGWRWMFWAENVPAFFFFTLAFIIPESPRWLATVGRERESKAVLAKIVGNSEVDRVYSAIREQHNESNDKSVSKELFSSKMRGVLIIGVVLAVFQQWCGINVIFNYAQEIFQAAGYGVSDMLLNIVITGITNLVFTFVAIFTVDKLGRRPLLIFGSAGLFFIYLVLSGAYYFGLTGLPLLIIVVFAIACYAVSLAPVMWVVISEIFPTRLRGAAMGVATFALWAASFILTYTFPIMNGAFGAAGTFFTYSIICLLGALFILKKVPETKGKSLEEIERKLI